MSQFSFVSLIEFIRSKLSFLVAHVIGVSEGELRWMGAGDTDVQQVVDKGFGRTVQQFRPYMRTTKCWFTIIICVGG